MLTGAVLGGIFASPSVSSILAAIRATTLPTSEGGKGCLLIVKNYTGDRLNFGMACETANAEGRSVRMVVVADDCAVPRTKGITGARGVAGTVLVHKFAGASAKSGKNLEDVLAIAESVASNIGSLGVALGAVTVPGAEVVNDRLDGDTIEIGMGIHGEAGMRQSPILSADDIAGEMLSAIQTYGKLAGPKGAEYVAPLYERGDDLVVLVNNLGGASNFELSILANSLVKKLEGEARCRVTRLYVGSLMTSFDMRGASVSILPASKESKILGLLEEYLDAETDAPAWIAADIWASDSKVRPSLVDIPEVPAPTAGDATSDPRPLPPVDMPNFSSTALSSIQAACTALLAAEPILTKYDTIVGDGDCGITMARGATEVSSRANAGKLRSDHPSSLFSDLADAVSASMGGTSGVLLELMFRKASTVLADSEGVVDGKISARDMAVAFQAGVEAVSFYGGACEGSRTMLDALCPASAAMLKAAVGANLGNAAKAARCGADATAEMDHAEAGRSNYLSESVLLGTPDPGAVAVAVVLEAVAKAVSSS